MDELSLCKYCLGCNSLEDTSFIEKKRCKNFIPGINNYQELILNAMKNIKK